MKITNLLLVSASLALLGMGCTPKPQASQTAQAAETATPAASLKEVYQGDFYIGAALNGNHVSGRDAQGQALVAQQFNTISPENLLKFGPVHPRPNEYNFKPADDYVAFGEQHNMFIVGHTLVWHQQTPNWVFEDEAGKQVSREVLLQRLQEHISTVAGRYKGRIHGWDVVNEALNEDGTLRKTKWLDIIGEDYLVKAFEMARQADPEMELYYNDYSIWKPAKRDGTVRLVKNLQAAGIPVAAIGMQGHYGIDYPTLEQIEASILAFSALGVKVNVTELDIDLLPNPSNRQGADIDDTFEAREGFNPYANGLPAHVEEKLNKRYAEIFALFYKHRDKIDRITLWGVTDADSWLNNWPMKGRTSYPMLFDRQYQPKPAFQAVLDLKQKR